MTTKFTELSKEIINLQNGNIEAFEAIYNASYSQAYFTALKICKNEDDAQDVLQEAYIYLLAKINVLKCPEAFMSWFNMVVANKAKNHLRKNDSLIFNDLQDVQRAPCFFENDNYCPITYVEQKYLREDIIKMIDNLTDEKRTVVILYYFNEMTTKQISKAIGINENTIKSRLNQAKKDLRKWIEL